MESGRESRVLSALELPVFFPRFFRRRGHQGVFTFLPRFRETIPPDTRSLVFPSIRGEIENRTKFLFFFFFWKQTIFLNRFQGGEIGNDFFETNRYISRAFVTKYFEIIFSASLFKNSLDEPRNGEERKIAKGKNDKSVGRYSIRIGRRVSRLVEGWRKGKGQGTNNRKTGLLVVGGARAGGDAKVPFEDSYFPRSHRCHTSPAILRLSLHCGNHNYTCGCLLIAPPPPRLAGRSLRGEKEGGRESLLAFFSILLFPLFLQLSSWNRSFPSRFSEKILRGFLFERRGRRWLEFFERKKILK